MTSDEPAGESQNSEPAEPAEPEPQPWDLVNQPAAGYRGHFIRPRGLLPANSPLRMRTVGATGSTARSAAGSTNFSALAIVSLVLAILIPPAGIICGHIALSRIKRLHLDGRGWALAGTIVGYVLTVFWVLAVTAVILFVSLRWGPSSWTYSSY